MNKLFDCFNSRHSLDKDIFKKNLSSENKRIIFDFFHETIKYLTSLRVEVIYFKKNEDEDVDCADDEESDKKEQQKKKKKKVVQRIEIKPIIHTRQKTAFRGFIIDMISLEAMFKFYVEEEALIDSIPTYNLLQDVLEMMFARIRSCGGFNNNPNLQQFKGAFRKIQCNMRLDLSPNTNCRMFDSHLPENLFFSNIYTVSSVRPKVELNEEVYESQKNIILEIIENEDDQHHEAKDPSNAVSSMLPSDFMIMYYATLIEGDLSKIIETDNKGFYCNKEGSSCRTVFLENQKVCSVDLPFSSYKPCVSTIEICKRTEIFFKLYDGHKSNPKYDFKTLYCLVFRSMDMHKLFSNSGFRCDPTHKYQFIKCIVSQYIKKRATQISHQFTLERQGPLIREQYKRIVNFRGQ